MAHLLDPYLARFFLPKTCEKRELLFRKNMSFLSEKAKAIPKLQEQNVFHKFLVVLKAK